MAVPGIFLPSKFFNGSDTDALQVIPRMALIALYELPTVISTTTYAYLLIFPDFRLPI